MNPVVAKSSPPGPPNAAADTGIRAVPCPAIQYPYCRYTPGSLTTKHLLGPEDRLPHPEPGRDRHHREQRDGRRVTPRRASARAASGHSASPNLGQRTGSRRIAK